MSASANVCPGCGHKFEASGSQDATPVRDAVEVEVRSGELVEMTPEMMELVRQRKRSELIRARSKADLIKLGESRNYKNPEFWAGKIIEERNQWSGA